MFALILFLALSSPQAPCPPQAPQAGPTRPAPAGKGWEWTDEGGGYWWRYKSEHATSTRIQSSTCPDECPCGCSEGRLCECSKKAKKVCPCGAACPSGEACEGGADCTCAARVQECAEVGCSSCGGNGSAGLFGRRRGSAPTVINPVQVQSYSSVPFYSQPTYSSAPAYSCGPHGCAPYPSTMTWAQPVYQTAPVVTYPSPVQSWHAQPIYRSAPMRQYAPPIFTGGNCPGGNCLPGR